MSFLTVVVILFVFIIAALLGIGIAYLLMRPSGCNFFLKNAPTQAITFFILSLIIFSLLFGAGTLYRASAYYRVVQYQFEDAQAVIQDGSLLDQKSDAWRADKPALVKEIWWQQMMLPDGDTHCYAGDQSICDLILSMGITVSSRWDSYLVFLGLGLTGVFAFLIYSIWILKLKVEEESIPEDTSRPRPRSKARR